MQDKVQKALAESLTSHTTEIIPYLPYLLQDFWSLSSDPAQMIDLLRTHTEFNNACRMLDLACGKEIASVCLAEAFACTAKGIDIIPEFIAEARRKAKEHAVEALCTFVAGDVTEAVNTETDYDLAVWGGAGNLLGSYPATLAGIARTVKPGGFILMDDAYTVNRQILRFHHDYLTEEEWMRAFAENGLRILSFVKGEQGVTSEAYMEDLNNIRRRAGELSDRHPELSSLFEDYVKNQQCEYEDLQDGVVPVLWLLQKFK